MKNIIGNKIKHKNGYEYLSLLPFPNADLKKTITEDILSKANKAQFLLGKLSGITLLLPDVEFFITSYIMKDATASSQIEGTKASIADAFEYKLDSTIDTDADDISHYVSALNYGLKRLREDNFPLTLRFIRELHNQLMKDARATHFADPGEFRKSQNWIGGTRPDNASFVPPAPEDLDSPLVDLEKFIHKSFAHPIIDAGFLHAQFETIHPFLDGNGRTGRLLITFYFMHHKYLELPALFLSSYFKKHQKVYYERLNQYHNGDVIPWILFFIDAIIETGEEAIEVSKKITSLRDSDLEKISRLHARSSEAALQIIKKLYKNPIVSTVNIQEWLGQTRQGAGKFINNLIKIGILELYKKSEGTRPALYVHKKYLKIFTEK